MSADLSLTTPRLHTVSLSRHRFALVLMAASGFAGLGYQIVWTQQSSLWLGHEAAAVLAVVTAFFGGLALGAATLGPRIERSERPRQWYAACEAVIAAWSVVLALGLAPLGQALLALTGAQPGPLWQGAVAFVGTFVVLLPATAAMGATLPAMERVLAGLGREGGGIGALYASNTLGAVVGVLAAAFWLVPEFGLARTAGLCAALNLLCAAAVLTWRGLPSAPKAERIDGGASSALLMLAGTGLLGIGYEVLVVRVLSQVAEDTVYTFALLLAVYLLGTAAGAAAHQRWLAARADAERLRGLLLLAQAAACLAGIASLWGAPMLRDAVIEALGGGLVAALAAEAALAVVAFALPTVVMGALFTHLVGQARGAGAHLGHAIGVNTLGAALAPLLFGVALAPAVGPKGALLLVVAGYLALGWRRAAAPGAWALALLAIVIAGVAPPLAFVDVPPGGRVLSYRDGPLAAVSVVEDADGIARLRINNRQQEGSSATRLADGRQAWLPLLLHPAPRHALFLGLGTGMTARSATLDPQLQVDAVELLPEVIAASSHFVAEEDDSARRLHVVAADARRYVRTAAQRYDVIVSDNFHPARSGSGALYTVEHFQAVRERLTGQGVFCQWLPLHQLDLATLRSIVRAFVEVYPGAGAMLATNSLETPVLGLVSRADAQSFDLGRVRERLAAAAAPAAEFGIADDYALLGSFVAGPAALKRFAASAPINSDDHPVVAYRAPRITYAADSTPRDRLFALLGEMRVAPDEVVAAAPETGWPLRLQAYRRARDQFLEAGRFVQASGDAQRMLAQVREPLLAALRSSADFRPAYDPLLRLAAAVARSDPAGARALLTELTQLNPARPEAALLLTRLGTAPP